MMSLALGDELAHVFMTGMYLPRQCFAGVSAADRQRSGAQSVEIGLARLVTAQVRHLGGRDMASWAVRHGEGQLAAFFGEEPRSTRYRLFVHTSSARVAPCLWDAAYQRLELPLTRRPVLAGALVQGVSVLAKVLDAYHDGDEAVDAYLRTVGHPVVWLPK
jgi:hypothetical protein